jgi:hypothetical protein
MSAPSPIPGLLALEYPRVVSTLAQNTTSSSAIRRSSYTICSNLLHFRVVVPPAAQCDHDAPRGKEFDFNRHAAGRPGSTIVTMCVTKFRNAP